MSELSERDPVEGPENLEAEIKKFPMSSEDVLRVCVVVKEVLWPKDCQGDIEKLVRAAVRDEFKTLTAKRPYEFYPHAGNQRKIS